MRNASNDSLITHRRHTQQHHTKDKKTRKQVFSRKQGSALQTGMFIPLQNMASTQRTQQNELQQHKDNTTDRQH